MFGKSNADFPGSFIPFDKQVGPVPTSFITDEPTRQLCINQDWLPFILGAMKAVSRPETWNDSYDAITRAASEVSYLISSLSDGCGTVVPTKLCLSGTFADSDYGYEDFGGGVCAASWVSGTGWVSCPDTPGSRDYLAVRRTLPTTVIRSYSFTADLGGAPRPFVGNITFRLAGVTQRVDNFTNPLTNLEVMSSSTPVTCDEIEIVTEFSVGPGASYALTDFSMCYTGAFPLSVSDHWEKVYDFTIDDRGWVQDGFNGVYVPDVGWQTSTAYDPGGPVTYRGMGIHKDFSPDTTIYEYIAEYTATVGSNTASIEGRYVYTWHDTAAPGNRFLQYLVADALSGVNWTGSPLTTPRLGFAITTGFNAGSSDPGGECTLTRIVLRGVGSPP